MIKFLTRNMQEILIKNCRTEKQRLVVIGLLDTGLRIKEFCSLKPVFFNFKAGLLVYDKKLIPLTLRATTVFKHWFKKHKSIGISPKGVYRIVKRVAENSRLNLEIKPSVFRNTYIINCLSEGITITEISNRTCLSQQVLGWYAVTILSHSKTYGKKKKPVTGQMVGK